MLFPELGPQYYEEKDRPILSKMEAFYAESITINQSFWGEADTDTRFMAGDQTAWNSIYGNLPAHQRKQFNFNRIRRCVDLTEGHQIRNRKSTIVTPYENGDNETADQFTKVLMWINNQEHVLETISTAFRGSLITGMNLLEVWMDYRSDPVSGNLRVDHCSYNSMLVDPFFRKLDFSDCNNIWKRSYLTKRECVSLLPNRMEEIMGMTGHPYGSKDSKFQFMPEAYAISGENLLTYDEFWYRDYRTQRMLVDAETGEVMEWSSSNEDGLKRFLKQYPQVTVIESEIPTVRLAIVVNGKVMYHGPNPYGTDKYPFIPVLAYYYPEMPYFPWRIQGMVRGLRDAQYLYNRRKVIELDILESQINSGWKYKENALVNPKDVFMSGQGRGLALKEDANMTDVEQIVAPGIPASMIQLSELLGKEISEISGVNEELLGAAENDDPGIKSMLRQSAGLTTLSRLFENLDVAQRLLGNVMIDMIQANFTPGKIKKILEGEEPSPQFYNKAFGKYHCVIEEGLNTSTQKQMAFANLLQMRELGVAIPDDVLLEASTIQNKKKLVEAVQKQSQAAQESQKQQMDMQMQEAQSRIELAKARSQADIGLGIERVSRVEENRQLAHKNEDEALLALVKSLKEIDDMDLAHLEKLINITHAIKANEQGLAEQAAAAKKDTVPAPNSSAAGR